MSEVSDEKIVFEVFALDVYKEDGGWVENERHWIGKMEVVPTLGRETDGPEILLAMARFSYLDPCGRRLRALTTTDRRRVYAEDYYGDGTWWEVGTVKDRMPVYGLRLMEGYGREEEAG